MRMTDLLSAPPDRGCLLPRKGNGQAVPLLDLEVSGKLGMLQLVDEAIALRFGRLDRPCLDCTTWLRCDEHAVNQQLLEMYKARYAAAWAEAFAGLDPDQIGKLVPADGTPPTTASLRAAVTARPREAAASGPVVIELDREQVVIELYGHALAEHSFLPAGSEGQPQTPADAWPVSATPPPDRLLAATSSGRFANS